MDEIILKIFSGGVSIYILYKILGFIFENFEPSPSLKTKLADIILVPSLLPFFENLRQYVLNLINSLFTKKHFSWICFKRGFFASALFILLLHAMYFFGHTYAWSKVSWGQVLAFSTGFIPFFLIYNTLDFFLLWKTRKLLEYSGTKKGKRAVCILGFDFVTSFLFGFIKYWVVMLLLVQKLPDINYFFTEVITIKASVGYPAENAVIPGLFFYGSFMYAVFLLLYYLSVYLCRKAGSINRFKNFITRFTDVKEEPVKFVKMVFGILLFLGAGIVLLIQVIV